MSKNLVTLSLGRGRAPGARAEVDVLRGTLDEAFGTFASVLEAGDTKKLADATMAAIDQCRSEIASGAAADVLDPLARSCFDALRTVAANARGLAVERRAQVATLVTMVQETVATIAGEQASLGETLAGSAERFERLAHVDDLQQIQAQLAREVATLKRITIERRAAWDQTLQEFGTRLTTLESQLDRTRREAAVDPLTNVANRRTFERTCREWLEGRRPGFVMAMADVDDFKMINDQYGHAVGDRVLVTVAETLSGSLRSGDLVARVGGDEFAILAAGLTLRQAEGRFAAIGRAVQQACGALPEDGLSASLSIGVAECSAGDTFDSMRHRADAALYQAKGNGKGRVAAKETALIRDLRRD